MSYVTMNGEDAAIRIKIYEENGSLHYDEELAKDLIELWRARHLLTADQKQRIHSITQEKYT